LLGVLGALLAHSAQSDEVPPDYLELRQTASDTTRRGTPTLAARWPWLVAFCFGLLHGFGFAGALAEVGLPHRAIPVALLFFNLGVEIGQLVFVAAVMMAGGLFRRAMALRLEPALVQQTVNWLDVTAAYAIGAVAAYWLFERTAAFIL